MALTLALTAAALQSRCHPRNPGTGVVTGRNSGGFPCGWDGTRGCCCWGYFVKLARWAACEAAPRCQFGNRAASPKRSRIRSFRQQSKLLPVSVQRPEPDVQVERGSRLVVAVAVRKARC